MKRNMINTLGNSINEKVKIQGWIQRIRSLKSISFIILRDKTGLVQCIIDNGKVDCALKLESVVTIIGEVKENNNKLNNYEVVVEELKVLNISKEELPIEINKENLELNLDTLLNNRVLSLRHEKINAIFKIQNIIVKSFRNFLAKEGFTEVFTPKIVENGAEGGSEVFEIKYFEKKAYLAQSPQFYKQMMVCAGFERVFEIGHAYRAEEHNTNRHLNEYVSMDLEMGFIESEEDIMKLEEELLKYIINEINQNASEYINLLSIKLPIIDKIPRMKLSEAIEILKKEYNKVELEGDLDPEGELLICEYAKKKLGSEFIFLTNYPKQKRPMYTMPNEDNTTKSFDLLFRGIEITTGGQRIHEYNQLIKNIKDKNLEPNNYESYIEIFKYGVPPHGGLAIGLERLTSKLLNLDNVRKACLITRDRTRLTP